MAKAVKLPESKMPVATGPALDSKIIRILWAVDPARLRIVSDEVMHNLIQLSADHAVKEAELEIKIRENDIKAFNGIKQIFK